MKKKLILILMPVMMAFSAVACGGNGNDSKDSSSASTDEVVDTESQESEASWEISYYIDEFGDPTDVGNLKGVFSGTFSNTATNGSDLNVVMFFNISDNSEAEFNIRLLEYGNQVATYSKSETGYAFFDMLTKIDGEVSEFSLHGNPPNDDLILWDRQDDPQATKIKDYLYEGKKISCVININNSKYNFTIDGEGFAKSYDELYGLEESIKDTELETEYITETETGIETEVESKQNTESESYEITYQKAKVYPNSVGTIWIQSIFEITNTGTKPLYLDSGSCDLEDENGTLISSRSTILVYPDIINAGEKAYYYEETIIDNLDSVIELNIIPRPNVKEASLEKIDFPVTDFKLSDSDSGIKMLGRVENTSNEAQNMIYIVAILFDEKDAPIGQIYTMLLDELAASDKIGFEGYEMSLPDNIKAKDISRYEVFAYPPQHQY